VKLLRSASAAVALALLLCGPALAQNIPMPQVTPTIEIQTNTSYGWLTNGLGNWSSYDLVVVKRDAERRAVYVDLEEAERFFKRDEQLLAGYYAPFTSRIAGVVELTTSTGLALPRSSEFAQLEYNSGSAWFEKFGVRHTDYTSASVNSGTFTLEHYWKSFRMSYSLTAADLAGSGINASYGLQVDDYYGKNGNDVIGIRLNAGREIENVGVPQLLVSHVSGWSIVGRYWISPKWAASYEIGSYVQGASYTRKGISLGLVRQF
jgi:YaiO family outer membrane protein